MKYRFLIDANISVALEAAAHARGHEAYHVRTLGRQNDGDPVLLKLIEAEGYTLVTNNIVEFRNRQLFHAGMVFIAEAARGRAYQLSDFSAALDHIEQVNVIDGHEVLVEPAPDGTCTTSQAQLP
ncbi:DUF5615 family PIN-like protein [Niveispirillum sp. KHB5.9]|uniref:DUF5615 family PIN-like protein n=1 Tax=Niveispirillum sp. KHB5.9 TaxID=3400269 RepID=UPI003A849C5D